MRNNEWMKKKSSKPLSTQRKVSMLWICHVGFGVRSAHCRNFQGRREYRVYCWHTKFSPTASKLPKWHHEAPIHGEFPLLPASRRPPKVPRSPKTKPTVSFLSIIPIYQQLSLKAVIKTVVPLLQLSSNIGGEFWFSKSSLDLKIDPLTNFNCER